MKQPWFTIKNQPFLGGGFKYFLFSPLLGEDSYFDLYFSDGLVQPPTRFIYIGKYTFRPIGWYGPAMSPVDLWCWISQAASFAGVPQRELGRFLGFLVANERKENRGITRNEGRHDFTWPKIPEVHQVCTEKVYPSSHNHGPVENCCISNISF